MESSSPVKTDIVNLDETGISVIAKLENMT
jgi:hypothetical protein